MHKQIVIRQAQECDVDGLAKVHIQAWHETYTNLIDQAFLNQISIEKSKIMFAKMYKDNIVALDGTEVIGFAGFSSARNCNMPNCGEIFALYVLQSHQKFGIGKTLMLECINQLKHFDAIIVWVLASNVKAIGFYEHFGFVADGTTMQVLLGSPETEIRLLKVNN